MRKLAAVPFLIIDDPAMRKPPATAAEDLLELIQRRYERVSTLLTSNRPVEDWGKLLGDVAAVGALLDRAPPPPPCPGRAPWGRHQPVPTPPTPVAGFDVSTPGRF